MGSTVNASQLDKLHTSYAGKAATRARGRQESTTDRLSLLSSSIRDRLKLGALEWLLRNNLLWRFNFTVSGSVDGHRVAVPIVGGEGMQVIRGDERWMFDLLKTLMSRRTGAFIDVGANLGQTLLKVKMINSDVPYYGFEPNPRACSYCHQLVRANQFKKVTLFPIGLSSSSDVVVLFTKSDTDPSGSIIAGFRTPDRYSNVQPVSVHKGDDVLNVLDLQDVALMKIDVEGGELDVLQGFANTLLKHRPVVLCEVLPVYDEMTPQGRFRRDRQRQLVQFLRNADYRIFRIRAPQAELLQQDDFGVHSDITLSNYLFAPPDVGVRECALV